MNEGMTTKISVIVPCYNYGKYLPECLESVRAQTRKDWECIIIDNGSTDNTAEVGKKFAADDSRFVYLHIEQKGVSYARNYGITQSKGVYILPLDADDRIGNTYLEKGVPVLEADRNVKLVYCEAMLFGAAEGKWQLPDYSFRDLLAENMIFCSAIYRKEDHLKTGGYNEKMQEGFEDWEHWIRLLSDGGSVYRIPEILFYYRIRAGSRNNSLDIEKQLRLRTLVFDEHRSLYEKYFNMPELIFENRKLKQELEMLKRSPDKKLGTVLLSPLRFLKNLTKTGS